MKTLDSPYVPVIDNNVDAAWRILQKRIATSGYMKILKFRKNHPAIGERRRQKARMALGRTLKKGRKS